MVRGRPEPGTNLDVGAVLNRLDDSLTELRTTLSSSDRGMNSLRSELDELRRGESELRELVDSIEASISGETRTLREQLVSQGHRLDALDAKLGQIESLNSSLINTIDDRLHNLNQQVTTAVIAVVVVVFIGLILLLVIR